MTSEQTSQRPSEVTGAGVPDELIPERERIDSGFESSQTNFTKRFGKAADGTLKVLQEKSLNKTTGLPETDTEIPWEIFLSGRKLTAAVYVRVEQEETSPDTTPRISTKLSVPRRTKPTHIKPVLQVELAHPAIVVNTLSSGSRIEVSCFDVSITGTSPEGGERVCRSRARFYGNE